MDAKQLRIGNFLNYDTAEGEILPTVIDWQDLKWISEDPNIFNLVHSSIPLTQEWLLKFGFFKHEGWFKKGNIVLYPVNNEYYRTGTHYGREMCTVKIEHVHQLQNLYFALTGEELTLKNK